MLSKNFFFWYFYCLYLFSIEKPKLDLAENNKMKFLSSSTGDEVEANETDDNEQQGTENKREHLKKKLTSDV
jgi:hypothetical protein